MTETWEEQLLDLSLAMGRPAVLAGGDTNAILPQAGRGRAARTAADDKGDLLEHFCRETGTVAINTELGTDPTCFHWGRREPDQRDHFLCPALSCFRAVAAAVLEGPAVSDHRPLQVKLVIPVVGGGRAKYHKPCRALVSFKTREACRRVWAEAGVEPTTGEILAATRRMTDIMRKAAGNNNEQTAKHAGDDEHKTRNWYKSMLAQARGNEPLQLHIAREMRRHRRRHRRRKNKENLQKALASATARRN